MKTSCIQMCPQTAWWNINHNYLPIYLVVCRHQHATFDLWNIEEVHKRTMASETVAFIVSSMYIYIYTCYPPRDLLFRRFKQMERTWQFEFRGDDTCQGCSADALKQKSKISLLAEVFENVHGGERRRDLFFILFKRITPSHRRQCPFHCIQVFAVLVRKAKAQRPTLSRYKEPLSGATNHHSGARPRRSRQPSCSRRSVWCWRGRQNVSRLHPHLY